MVSRCNGLGTSVTPFGRSAFTAASAIVAAADAAALAVTTGVTTVAGFGSIWVFCTASVATDLAVNHAFTGTTTSVPLAASAASFIADGTTLPRQGLAKNQTRYNWVCSVDTWASKSACSAMVRATIPALTTLVNSTGALSATAFASGIKPVAALAALPGQHVEARQPCRASGQKGKSRQRPTFATMPVGNTVSPQSKKCELDIRFISCCPARVVYHPITSD